MERRLFDDGGYYLDNGASLCGRCHLKAEQTLISCEEIRARAGITRVILPSHLYDDTRYDKWGNVILSDGRRVRGELFADPSVQKILREGGVLHLFTPYAKYPRTYHLPWSESISRDDRVLTDTSAFEGRRVVVTEKMDGENTTLYRDYLHARSVDGRHYPWQDWVRNLQARIGWEIPPGWRLCGENLFCKHAILYRDLPGYLLLFAIYDEENRCLSWDETVTYAEMLGIPTAPVLYDGIWDPERIKACYTGRSRYGDECEGYVVRLAESFPFARFRHSVAKFVRAGHVPEHGGHWRQGRLITNMLAAGV